MLIVMRVLSTWETTETGDRTQEKNHVIHIFLILKYMWNTKRFILVPDKGITKATHSREIA